jgi:hypothetical protein
MACIFIEHSFGNESCIVRILDLTSLLEGLGYSFAKFIVPREPRSQTIRVGAARFDNWYSKSTVTLRLCRFMNVEPGVMRSESTWQLLKHTAQ